MNGEINEVVNLDVLAWVVIASACIASLVEMIKDRFRLRWDALTDLQKENWGLVIFVLSAGLMALTRLDMLPVFSRVVPWGGYALTCIIGGMGPIAVYKIAMDAKRPAEPSS